MGTQCLLEQPIDWKVDSKDRQTGRQTDRQRGTQTSREMMPSKEFSPLIQNSRFNIISCGLKREWDANFLTCLSALKVVATLWGIPDWIIP